MHKVKLETRERRMFSKTTVDSMSIRYFNLNDFKCLIKILKSKSLTHSFVNAMFAFKCIL